MSIYVRCVREAGGLGDLIRCLSVSQGLQKKYPEARVHFYGATYLAPLIAPRSKAFDLYVPCEHDLRDREKPLNERIYKHLSRGVVYQESHDMWCWAYLHEPATIGIPVLDRTELWCQHAGVEPSRPKLSLLPQDIIWRDIYKERYSGRPIIGIQPGATCRSREWPYAYWDVLIKMLKEALNAHIILFDVCFRWQDKIELANVEPSIDRCWPETLGKLAACDLVVTPDSGFYHLAGALNLRTLGLFGCTSGQIISRPWNWGQSTHSYLQLKHGEIDFDMIPKTGSNKIGCSPICYMRWERGWCHDRYRKRGENCSLMIQLGAERVFDRVITILKEPKYG